MIDLSPAHRPQLSSPYRLQLRLTLDHQAKKVPPMNQQRGHLLLVLFAVMAVSGGYASPIHKSAIHDDFAFHSTDTVAASTVSVNSGTINRNGGSALQFYGDASNSGAISLGNSSGGNTL